MPLEALPRRQAGLAKWGSKLGWQSGQLHLPVEQAPLGLRGFESLPQHHLTSFGVNQFTLSGVEGPG